MYFRCVYSLSQALTSCFLFVLCSVSHELCSIFIPSAQHTIQPFLSSYMLTSFLSDFWLFWRTAPSPLFCVLCEYSLSSRFCLWPPCYFSFLCHFLPSTHYSLSSPRLRISQAIISQQHWNESHECSLVDSSANNMQQFHPANHVTSLARTRAWRMPSAQLHSKHMSFSHSPPSSSSSCLSQTS